MYTYTTIYFISVFSCAVCSPRFLSNWRTWACSPLSLFFVPFLLLISCHNWKTQYDYVSCFFSQMWAAKKNERSEEHREKRAVNTKKKKNSFCFSVTGLFCSMLNLRVHAKLCVVQQVTSKQKRAHTGSQIRSLGRTHARLIHEESISRRRTLMEKINNRTIRH